MWYFAWILGVLLAASCGIINLLWYEFHSDGFENNTKDVKDKFKS